MRYTKNLFVNNTLRIAITNVCGVEGGKDPNAKFMTLDTAREIANFIRAHKIRIRELHITGGEPLLHPNYLEIINILKEACFEGVNPDTYLINVDSNASLLTEDTIDSLKQAGVCQLTLGVDEYNGTALNLSGQKIDGDAMIDTLAHARDEMEITLIHRLIFDDFNIEDCISFKNKLDIPKSTKDNWGCLTIGNLPLGDSVLAKFLRYRHKKDYTITDECGDKHTMSKDVEDYRNNATTYLTEYRAVKALRRGKADPSMQVTELSPDFTDYKNTEVNYATIDIDGNLNMCHIPNVYRYDKMADRSEGYTRLDPVNVRNLKVKFTKTVDENGLVVMTPEYKVSTRKKMYMGDE